jgi:hypothetical protein
VSVAVLLLISLAVGYQLGIGPQGSWYGFSTYCSLP